MLGEFDKLPRTEEGNNVGIQETFVKADISLKFSKIVYPILYGPKKSNTFIKGRGKW